MATLLMMAIIGTFTYEFTISLPLMSEFAFHGGASSYAALSACMGIGAATGGIVTASQKPTGFRIVAVAALLFGISVLAVAVSPTLMVALIAMVVVGFFSITFTAIGNVTVQMNSEPEMRGRIMALWTVAFLGSTPIGGPIIGAIGENFGPRWSLAVGGVAAVIAAGIGSWLLKRRRTDATAVASKGIPVPVDRTPEPAVASGRAKPS
jgi:MFS family permease